MRTKTAILTLALSIPVASPAEAQTAQIGMTRLDYAVDSAASEACPKKATFLDLVAARMQGEDPFSRDGSSTMEIVFTREEGLFRARVRLLDAAGDAVREKTRAAEDCDRLADAIAFDVSLSLVPPPKPPPPPPPPPLRVVAEAPKKISGLEIDLAAGYSEIFGTLEGKDFYLTTYGTVVVDLVLGYRVSETFSIGLYGQYGRGIINTDDMSGCVELDCTLSSYRFGLDMQLHTNPRGVADPWFGLRLGYEVFDFQVHGYRSFSTQIVSANYQDYLHGPEYFHGLFGVDFSAGRVRIGPYLGASVGTFLVRKSLFMATSTSGQSAAEYKDSLSEISPHTWPTMGVRIGLGF